MFNIICINKIDLSNVDPYLQSQVLRSEQLNEYRRNLILIDQLRAPGKDCTVTNSRCGLRFPCSLDTLQGELNNQTSLLYGFHWK